MTMMRQGWPDRCRRFATDAWPRGAAGCRRMPAVLLLFMHDTGPRAANQAGWMSTYGAALMGTPQIVTAERLATVGAGLAPSRRMRRRDGASAIEDRGGS
ncbi:hypothetical protein [Burkholderia plantarii]|uniref:hypothetical protein n=1 Tax=Burkholderia plantarii TaxID=41899 RepID=UPI0006D88BA2|nr:hypothetical protein [Burkholderia plantarii]GLZ20353.1 hypothetical protein Bpla01_38820 [Burkholderia plantarii]